MQIDRKLMFIEKCPEGAVTGPLVLWFINMFTAFKGSQFYSYSVQHKQTRNPNCFVILANIPRKPNEESIFFVILANIPRKTVCKLSDHLCKKQSVLAMTNMMLDARKCGLKSPKGLFYRSKCRALIIYCTCLCCLHIEMRILHMPLLYLIVQDDYMKGSK